MNSLLFNIALSAVLSTVSFLIVIVRVSPLTAPTYALPSFFISLFLLTCTNSTLLYIWIWKLVPHHTWDTGKLMSISLREGIFTGIMCTLIAIFLLFQLLTWWILLLILLVFGCLELALKH